MGCRLWLWEWSHLNPTSCGTAAASDKAVITFRHARLILLHGMLIALAGAATFLLVSRDPDVPLDQVRTATFCTIAFAQLFFSIACRSPRRTMPELGLFSNPYLLAAIAASVLLQIGTVTIPGIPPRIWRR